MGQKGKAMATLGIAGVLIAAAIKGKQLTLNVAAYNSSESDKAQADYICDGLSDEIEIQNAIDAVSISGRGRVVLFPGTYIVSGNIKLRSNVTLMGLNWDSLLIAESGINNHIILITSDNCTLRQLRLDGNGTNNRQTVIYVRDCTNVLLHSLLAENAGWDNIAVASGASNIKLNEIWSRNAGIYPDDDGAGLEITGDCHDVLATNLHISDCARKQGGLYFSTHAGAPHGHNIVVKNAEIINCARAIGCDGLPGISPFEQVLIDGVLIDGTTHPTEAYGININGKLINNLEIANFIIRNTGAGGTGARIAGGTPVGIKFRNGEVYNAGGNGYEMACDGIEAIDCLSQEARGDGFYVPGNYCRLERPKAIRNSVNFNITGVGVELIEPYEEV